jgi:putative toxin-antitoxin system antitoxin component (TIGR02293 family)
MAVKRAPKGATPQRSFIKVRKRGLGKTLAEKASLVVVSTGVGKSHSLVRMLVSGTDPAQIRDAIVGGSILGSRLREMRNELRLTVDVMARLLDVAPRTVNRKESSEQPLSVSEGDRAFRIARIADLAIEMIGDRDKAMSWLHKPNTYLGRKTPIEMLDTEIGADLVAESLHAIAFGGVA